LRTMRNSAAKARAVGGVLSLVAVFFATAGCDGRPQLAEAGQMGAVHAYVDQLETIASVLTTVVDDETAREAAPRIRTIAREMASIRGRIGQLQNGDLDDIGARFGERIAQASATLRRETERIGEQPGLVEEVQEALAAVPPLG
jgi:hypothetical protein